MTPVEIAARTWLLGWVVGKSRRSAPPVPTTNSPDPPLPVEVPVGILRGESLVVVIVAVDHEVGSGVVQRLPERRDVLIVAVLSGAEPRVMPDRDRAVCLARAQVVRQPASLFGRGLASPDR